MKPLHHVSRALMVVGAAGLVWLLVVVVADVTLRGLTGRGIRGSSELAETALPIVAYLPMGYTQLKGGHVSATFVVDRVPPVVAGVMRGTGLLVAAGFTAVVALLAADAAWDAWVDSDFRYGVRSVPLWPIRSAIALGLIALTIELVMSAAAEARGVRRGGEPDAADAPADPTGSLDARATATESTVEESRP